MEITNHDTNSPTISIEIPKGHEPQYTRVGDYIKLTFEPKEQPKPLPMSWEELGTISGFTVLTNSGISETNEYRATKLNKNIFPAREEAEASVALAQLLQLRNAWSGKHSDDFRHEADVYWSVNFSNVFCFHEKELRNRFQTQFADLIKTASPLL